MFEFIGKFHGKAKGKALRITHLASNVSLLDGQKLLDNARDFGGQRFNKLPAEIDNKELYLDYFVPAFILTYTDSRVAIVKNVVPQFLPSPKSEVKENFEEAIQVPYTTIEEEHV